MKKPAAFQNGVKVSERHGAGDWIAERASSLVLVPLALWGLWSGFVLAGAGYAAVQDWFANPINAVVLGLTHLLVLWHANLGMTVIIDDYIHKPASRTALVVLNGLFCLVLAAVGVFLIGRLMLGSAPLPAGLGV
ncbi:succinate dehydrogenase, hydrophobic membrane anchor protein [soil metagenome]